AESKLFQKDWLGLPAIYKIRQPKTYRIKELDFSFRKYRTIHEARLLARAKKSGVRTPFIYEVDVENTTLVLEFITGKIMKELLPLLDKKKLQTICILIGRNVGLLHKNGVIHGDLTTSNIIQSIDEQIIFVDFGLGYISERIEDFGIDLYLLERAMQSTHADIYQDVWMNILKGYKETSPAKNEIEEKLKEIASRGRYSERVLP
ncbi:MAG: KEOPS complex kinase/ATPase Bud32, partial [Candidatus Heimdallarchaeota archaeon]